MRCYFLRGGHIVAVEELPGFSDAEAVEKASWLFAARRRMYDLDRLEVWKRTQFIFQYPDPVGRANHMGSGTSARLLNQGDNPAYLHGSRSLPAAAHDQL